MTQKRKNEVKKTLKDIGIALIVEIIMIVLGLLIRSWLIKIHPFFSAIHISNYILLFVNLTFVFIIATFYNRIMILATKISRNHIYIIKIIIIFVLVIVFMIFFIYYIYLGGNSYKENFDKPDVLLDILVNTFVNIIISIGINVFSIISMHLAFPINFASQIGYVATCFPMYHHDNTIESILIFNPNHNQWMFPGGHVNTDVGEQHSDIAIKKSKIEAGLNDIKIINSLPTIPAYSSCSPCISPNYIYKMSVNPNVSCHKSQGHTTHYDYIYIGEYDPKNIKSPSFETIMIKIDIAEEITPDKIRNTIRTEIIKHSETKHNKKPDAIPLLEDIPDRLCCAMHEYINYKKLTPSVESTPIVMPGK
jgi:hypothetical protein